MEIDKNNVIRRFHDIIYAPDVPALYGQGLTDYEILVRLAKVVNVNADTMTNWLAIEKELESLLENADEIIKNNVIDTIHTMYDNGDFNEIFNELIENYLTNALPLNTNLNFRRLHRNLWNIGDNYVYSTDVVRPSKLEGGTFIKNYGSNNYYLYCLVPDGVHSYGHNNSGAIILINATTGEIAGQVAVTMNHMNSCDFNPNDGFVYIAGCLSYTGNNSNDFIKDSKIYRIAITEIIGKNLPSVNSDYYDLSHLSDVSAYHPVYTSIDLDNIIFDVPSACDISSNNVSWSNNLPANHIYCGTGYCRIYEIDFENQEIINKLYTDTLTTEYTALYNSIQWGNQTTIVHKNYLYHVIYNPTCIIRSNLDTQHIDFIYNLPQIADKGYYIMGEVEDIKIDDETGDLYAFSDFNIFQGNCRQRRMTQIFKSNIYKNEIESKTTINLNKKEPYVVYVDRTVTNHNPTGLTDSPFSGIDEAVSFANNNEIADAITIRMRSNSNRAVEITTSKKVKINKAPDAQIVETDTHNKMSVGGIICSGANVILEDLNIHASLPTGSEGGHAYIYSYDSNLTCNRIFITRNNTDLERAYSFEYSFGQISGTGEFTVESGKETTNDGIGWSGSTFINHSASTINAHQWATLNRGVIA